MLAVKVSSFRRFIALAACLLSKGSFAAAWVASADQRQGLPAISRGGVNALSSSFVFWGKNWIWAETQSEFKVVAPFEYSNATVAIQSMDEKLISNSRAILISLGARSVPKSDDELPFYSEPVDGRLSIRAPRGLKLYKNYYSAQDRREITTRYRNGRYCIDLDRRMATYWLLLK